MAKPINIDDILAHSVHLARLEGRGFRSFIAPSMAEALRDIRRLLADVDTITSRRQLRAIETAITSIVRDQTGWAALTSELDGLAMYENEFFTRLVGTGTTAAAAERVTKLANNTMMVLRSGEQFNTGLWPDFARNNLESQAQRVNNIVRTGYANGLTGREMRGSISRLFDGILTREAEALARTGYAHYSSVGRQAFAQANKDIIDREVPIATFDSRTSETCVSISARYGQKGWPVGESPIGYPPYHINCRTTIVPLAKGQELSGTRSSRGDQPGQIPANTTIDNFVKNQSADFQNELLGRTRAQLFREGRLDLRSLTNARMQPLTLDELRRRGI